MAARYREHTGTQQFGGYGRFEVIPEEVAVIHDHSGVQLAGSQRLAEDAFSSWRVTRAPSTSLTSGLSLSTRSSDIDLKEFLLQRGNQPSEGLHKAAAHGDHISIMHIMKHLGPDAPLNEVDGNGCTPLMYAVMADSRLAIEMLLNFRARREQSDPEGRTAVHYAAFFGKHRSLKFLIDTASDWTSRDVYGRTPLHWASLSKGTRCLSVLLKHAQTVLGNINPKDSEDMTPLHCTAQFGRVRNILLLSEAGCDFSVVDREGKTALHWTAGNHDSACFLAILDSYPPLLNRRDTNGSTLLHLVALNGSAQLVEALLQVAGINIDLLDNAERTPLHCCCVEGHANVAKLLLAFGALDSYIDFYGYTALHYAVQSSITECVEVFSHIQGLSHLPERNTGKTPLMLATQNSADKTVEVLLMNDNVRKTINHTSTEGRTALHLSCQSGSSSCTSLLLSHGADPNLQDNLGRSPLMVFCTEGHTACIHPLIAGGAETGLEDADGYSPLVRAVLCGHRAVVQALALSGVDLNRHIQSGATAAHVAAYSGNDAILSTLLENGAAPNSQDTNGMSCVHMAALEGHTHCVRILAHHRAFLNYIDYSENRYTPLDYAINYGHSECAEELSRNGAVSIHTIRNMAAICIQTCFRGFRARRLMSSLKQRSQAVTVLACHVRRYLQQKRYKEMKKRHYAAIRIQATFKAHRQRLQFQFDRQHFLELEKKQILIENYAKLVLNQKQHILPTTEKHYEKDEEICSSQDGEAMERQARLEAAMKMREIYEEKQKRWEEFRAAERQRRIDKAKKAELDRLAIVLSQSKARREYTQIKFLQVRSVRTHYQAAVVIQRAFRAMRLRKSWQRKAKVWIESEKKWQENKAAIVIQRAWRHYQQYRIYQATYFRAVYTSPVVPIPKKHSQNNQVPSYKKNTSITGNPRRKVHQTCLSGFRIPRPTTQDLFGSVICSGQNCSQTSYPWNQMQKQLVGLSLKDRPCTIKMSSTSLSIKQNRKGKGKGNLLPELVSHRKLMSKQNSFSRLPSPNFLPQIHSFK